MNHRRPIRRTRIVLVCALLCLGAMQNEASADLQWQVSVKRVFDASGNPPGTGLSCGLVSGNDVALLTVAQIEAKMEYANDVMERAGRGYYFDYAISDLPKAPAPPSDISKIPNCCVAVPPSTNPVCTPTECSNWSLDDWSQIPGNGCAGCVLDYEARQDPAGFAYDPGAFNIYIVDICAGGSANPRTDATAPLRVIFIGHNVQGSATRFAHELGHGLNLHHPHRGQPGPTCSLLGLGDGDLVADTLPDYSGCADVNELSTANFGVDFDGLPSVWQERILDLWFNVMAYHQDNDPGFWFDSGAATQPLFQCPMDDILVPDGCEVVGYGVECPDQPTTYPCRHRLTPDQLDRATDRSNALFSLYPGLVDGITHFVDVSGHDLLPGISAAPYRTIDRALDVCQGNSNDDIVLLRSGSYTEPMVIDGSVRGPVTLRASRGSAVIDGGP